MWRHRAIEAGGGGCRKQEEKIQEEIPESRVEISSFFLASQFPLLSVRELSPFPLPPTTSSLTAVILAPVHFPLAV